MAKATRLNAKYSKLRAQWEPSIRASLIEGYRLRFGSDVLSSLAQIDLGQTLRILYATMEKWFDHTQPLEGDVVKLWTNGAWVESRIAVIDYLHVDVEQGWCVARMQLEKAIRFYYSTRCCGSGCPAQQVYIAKFESLGDYEVTLGRFWQWLVGDNAAGRGLEFNMPVRKFVACDVGSNQENKLRGDHGEGQSQK